MSEHHSAPPASLCSWPPSSTLLSLHLFARGIVIMTDIIGFSLLYAAGFGHNVPRGDCAIVGGSFLLSGLILTPFTMIWNGRLLKRVKRLNKQQQSQDVDRSPPRFKTGALRFVTYLDGFGALCFFVVYIPVIIGATADSWWDTGASLRVIEAYGSVSVLCAAITHLFLFVTQALQLHSAACLHKGQKMVCPHCNHAMARVSTSSDFRTPPESMAAEQNDDMLVDSLVDTRIGMNPGQETGTTYKTPRQSEHQSRAPAPVSSEGEANETGEGEQDALIAKNG